MIAPKALRTLTLFVKPGADGSSQNLLDATDHRLEAATGFKLGHLLFAPAAALDPLAWTS